MSYFAVLSPKYFPHFIFSQSIPRAPTLNINLDNETELNEGELSTFDAYSEEDLDSAAVELLEVNSFSLHNSCYKQYKTLQPIVKSSTSNKNLLSQLH